MGRTLLVTGFEPFGGESVNPAWEAVSRLEDMIGEYTLRKLRVPVEFGAAGDAVMKAFDAWNADDILCVGQAGGRAALTPELVAVNRRAAIPDSAGYTPEKGEECVSGAPSMRFSTLHVMNMVRAAEDAGVRAEVSFSAGLYVCNDLMYRVINETLGKQGRAGFVHVPFLPEQAKDERPSMPLEDMVKGLTAMIRAM